MDAQIRANGGLRMFVGRLHRYFRVAVTCLTPKVHLRPPSALGDNQQTMIGIVSRFVVLAALFCFGTAASAAARVEHVFIISIDGGKPEGIRHSKMPVLQKLVKEQGFLIDGGYGKIKGTTFRISNMGDETEATMNQIIAALDQAMGKI